MIADILAVAHTSKGFSLTFSDKTIRYLGYYEDILSRKIYEDNNIKSNELHHLKTHVNSSNDIRRMFYDDSSRSVRNDGDDENKHPSSCVNV